MTSLDHVWSPRRDPVDGRTGSV